MNCMVFDGFGGWLYGYLWGPLVYIICSVLAGPCMCMSWGRHVHCINHFEIVMSWG